MVKVETRNGSISKFVRMNLENLVRFVLNLNQHGMTGGGWTVERAMARPSATLSGLPRSMRSVSAKETAGGRRPPCAGLLEVSCPAAAAPHDAAARGRWGCRRQARDRSGARLQRPAQKMY